MKFNAKDLNPSALLNRAKEEANHIYSSPSKRNGRTLNDIIVQCCYGHAVEQYLIEKEGFTDNPEPFQDLIDPQGNRVEIKVTEGDYYVPYVLERAKKAKLTPWRKHPDILYIFIGNKKTLDYSLYGQYEWHNKTFVYKQ